MPVDVSSPERSVVKALRTWIYKGEAYRTGEIVIIQGPGAAKFADGLAARGNGATLRRRLPVGMGWTDKCRVIDMEGER